MKTKAFGKYLIAAVIIGAGVLLYQKYSGSHDSTIESEFNSDLRLGLSDQLPRSIELRGPVNLVFASSDDGWIENNNPKIPIDSQAVEDLFSEIRHLQADMIFDGELSGNPFAKVILNYGQSDDQSDEQLQSAEIEFLDSGDLVVYTRSQDNRKFQIDKTKLQFLNRLLDEYRDKSYPFRFDQFQADALVVKRESDKYEFEVTKEGSIWVEQPESKHRAPDGAKIDEFLNQLRLLTVSQFLDAIGRAAPTDNKIRISDSARRPLFELAFGDRFDVDGIPYYVVKTSLSEELFAVEAQSLEVIRDLEIFKSVSH